MFLFCDFRSQMISQDDFNFISRFDSADAQGRDALIRENPSQLAKTFFSLLSQISKDTTLQYLLTLLDDLLQVCLAVIMLRPFCLSSAPFPISTIVLSKFCTAHVHVIIGMLTLEFRCIPGSGRRCS